MVHFDWPGVLSGQPWQWFLSGCLTTLWVTLAGALLATLLTVGLLVLRLSGSRAGTWFTRLWVSLFRNTPILVQLLFWYFAAWNFLPGAVRNWVNESHPGAILPGNVWWLTPEFLCAAWGLAVFTAAFLVEEITAGLRSIPPGQREAARAQGMSNGAQLRYVLLPQAMANAWQPVVGQYVNLMKLSSLASGIGFAELTYQVRQIESYNAHALEAYALGTLAYLVIGTTMGTVLSLCGPRRHRARRPVHVPAGQETCDER